MADHEEEGASVEVEAISMGGGGGHQSLADKVAGNLRSFSAGQPTRVMGPGVEKKGASGKVQKADEGGAEETVQASSLPPEEQQNQAFTMAGALLPPWEPLVLLEIYRRSNSLRSNIDAYKTNIDGFGYTLEPIIDLDSDEARSMAAEELRREIEEGRKEEDREGELPDFESDDWEKIVDERIERLKRAAAEEKIRLRNFWDYCALNMSFTQLRKRTRQDLELIGYGGWEVLKNRKGGVAKFVHVPAQTLRLMPADREPMKVEVQERIGPFKMEPVDIFYRFRRFVHYQTSFGVQSGQGGSGQTVYLKEWGDPRTVSQRSGDYYPDVEALKKVEGDDAKPARELLYFDLHNPDSPYGEPRWLGALLSVMGSRESEEVNYLYFRNKSIPPMVLLISGGKIGKDEKEKIKDYVERELQGSTGGFHKILIITARTDASTGEVPKMEFKPLTEALLNEGIFQGYDERNIDKTGMQFRQPRLLRGDIRDFNRATADAALRFTEAQVYSGERTDFDFEMNRKVMTRLEAKFWRLVSNPPPLRDPEAVIDLVEKMMKTNVMVPAEARRELSKAGVQLDTIDEAWTKRPIPITLSGVGFEPEEGERVKQKDVAQAPAEGEEPTAPLAGPAQGGEAGSEGLKALEKELFAQAQAKGVTPSVLRSMNRAEILQQLNGEGDGALEDLLDGLGIE